MRARAMLGLVALAFAGCSEPAGPAVSADYEAIVITADRGFPLGEAFAFNDSGVVVGLLSADRSSWSQIFAWRNGVFQDLGTLGSLAALPNAVNNHGVIAGTALVAVDEPAHAFISDGVHFTDLGFAGEARAINDLGDVVGIRIDSLYQRVAFRWRTGSPATPVDPSARMYEANDINDAGVIVGVAHLPECPYDCAAMWTGTTLVALPLGPDVSQCGPVVYPLSVNSSGVVVGWGYCPGGVFNTRAIRWQGGAEFLPTLSDGPSHAVHVADNGDIVGGSTDKDGVYHPVLWRNGELIVLPMPQGYSAAQARGISASGEIMGLAASAASVYQVVVWRPITPLP